MKKTEIRQQLLHPRKEARGRTRWWWYGCAVKKEELLRELDEMQRAEMGGVELQILYPLMADDPEKGVKNQWYLSPQYMELIRFAAEEAEKRGMEFDLTLGSSWPFGGPFIPEELSGQSVIPFTIDVEGPTTFQKDLTTVIYGKVVGVVLGKMEGARMLPETIVDITDRVVDKHLFQWPWGTEIEPIEIPEGLYKIVLFVSSDKRQQVLKPLPGGDGPIIDHNRKEALREFLSYGGNPIVEAVGRGKIHAFFCDSIEVFGHNWTEILYEEFRKRRGYELRPYLYALWGEIKGMTEQVRYDFQKTMAELTVENFFQELTKWCHENGSLSRIQAHGTWGDILAAYGAADIPEGETFSAFDRYEVNTVHRRLAVSAGHIYGKPVISNESFTWLRFPRFVVSLENLKAAADSIFLDGINQIVNHGYSYSEEQGEGMLSFYASSNINHTNTWWKDYPLVSRYINRVSDFLQRGEPVAEVAIYLPQHDIWVKMPLADTHMSMKLNERFGERCINGIQKAGYWFDYVNDDGVQDLGQRGYDTLLLIDCERIPPETMDAVCRFARNGGTVVAAKSLPSKACGMAGYQANTEKVRSMGQALLQEGRILVTEDKYEDLLNTLKKQKCPDVRFEHHPDEIGYVHRRTEDGDLYFIANISPGEQEETIWFRGGEPRFSVFDPMDCREKAVISMEETDEAFKVTLKLEPFQSLLFLFGEGEPLLERQTEQRKLLDLSEGWILRVPQRSFEKHCHTLQGWEKEEKLTYYSGTGEYGRRVVLTEEIWEEIQKADQVWLNLEHVGETAEIWINGKRGDVLIKRPYRAGIKEFLKKGENEITIRVTNLLINRMIDPDYPEPVIEEKVIPHWPFATGALNNSRRERLFNWREREMIKQPLPSGMWGTIALLAEKNI